MRFCGGLEPGTCTVRLATRRSGRRPRPSRPTPTVQVHGRSPITRRRNHRQRRATRPPSPPLSDGAILLKTRRPKASTNTRGDGGQLGDSHGVSGSRWVGGARQHGATVVNSSAAVDYDGGSLKRAALTILRFVCHGGSGGAIDAGITPTELVGILHGSSNSTAWRDCAPKPAGLSCAVASPSSPIHRL